MCAFGVEQHVSETILLDGSSLTRAQLVAVARHGASVALDQIQLQSVQKAADFLAGKVSCGEPTYGVTTGFGSNADKLLGAHRLRVLGTPRKLVGLAGFGLEVVEYV